MSRQFDNVTFADLIAQEILEIGDGYRAKLEELGGDGPIFLRAGLLSERRLNWDGEKFRTEIIPKLKSKLGRAGDTLVTTKGNSVGRTGYVPQGAPSFVYSPHLSYWRSLDTRKLSPRFLYYWSSSHQFTSQLRAMAHSTDMAPYLSLADQRRLKIRLPDISTQEAVARFLGALDDKIIANDQIATTSDGLVRAYYVRESRECDSVTRIDDLALVVRSTIAASMLDGSENYISLEDIPRRNMWLSSWGSSAGIVSAKSRFAAGDILFGKLRPYFHKVGVAFIGGVSSTDILVVRPRAPYFHGWLLAALASDEVVRHASAVGDGTRMPRARWNDLATFEVPWIGAERAAAFNDMVASLMGRVRTAAMESIALTNLRDLLLPKLISGQVSVQSAEQIAEDLR